MQFEITIDGRKVCTNDRETAAMMFRLCAEIVTPTITSARLEELHAMLERELKTRKEGQDHGNVH